MHSVVSIILGALGLGLLIFIHELGHYFMARRAGMKVEAFGIGFGKPIKTWTHKGVKWNLCVLPFGGYVKIAGMDKQGALEPHQIEDGFYGKKPWQRIKVALAGPVVNLVFAFFLYTVIWVSGGREKPFSEFTNRFGWVDPESKLYMSGIRPGDEITSVDGKPFNRFLDLTYALILEDKQRLTLKGFKVDDLDDSKTAFTVNLDAGRDKEGLPMLGMIAPANFVMYNTLPNGASPMAPGSPLDQSGIQNGDRILSIDGELVYSATQMVALLNEPKALVTVKRDSDIFLARIPRVRVGDLRINANGRGEFDDWQHAAGLNVKASDLYFLPYNMSNHCVVEEAFSYLNEKAEIKTTSDALLQPGDKVVAIDGMQVETPLEMLKALQNRRVHLIIQRNAQSIPIEWREADTDFFTGVNWDDFTALVHSIGQRPISHLDNLALLPPIMPRAKADFPLSVEGKAKNEQQLNMSRAEIAKIEDPKQRALMMRALEAQQKRLMLGFTPQDRKIPYNPSPFTLFGEALDQTWRTFRSLATGHLSPKYLVGPVGMVQVMQYGWSTGMGEALYWLALISLNLGILNLLPIPVLDGGHICFSLYEAITKKRIRARTMERLIFPFIVLMIALFVYITYHDIVRLFSRLF
jgi:regulator of sigma E protease